MNVTYGGSAGLNEQIIIDTVTLFFDGNKVTNHLESPVEIRGPAKVVIPIGEDEDSIKNLRLDER